MSHPATLSPSPINFGEPSTSNFFTSRFPSAPANDFASFFDRRRTSHPHNQPLQRASEDMSERSQSQQRPRLEHRAEQTMIIDLTDEPEELPSRSNGDRSRSQRPPPLGRSDAVSLGEDFIDLTDDNGEDDLTITGERQLPPPPSAARPLPRPLRADLPPLLVAVPPRPINRVFPGHRHGGSSGVGGRGERHTQAHMAEVQYQMAQRMGQEIMDHIQAFHDVEQAMPGLMNYGQHAFVERKPQHVAPPPAKAGFTRSPEESQTIICPSCEEELIHKKDEEQPVAKKGGKAPSKKDREEHPFWVLKECGHVYCNSCFQNRSQSGKNGSVSFRESSKPSANSKSKSAKILCAVEDCESDVKSKDKWVGVFL
ncbi:hypothetical protein V8E51_009245 [Hyaloscypha variabilis]